MTVPADNNDKNDFSLMLGGPLFQLFRRAHLSGNMLELLRRRVIFATTICWLPLLLLSLLTGIHHAEDTFIPFYLDAGAQARFLIAVPFMLLAEITVHRRMRFVVKEFLSRQLVPSNAVAAFENARDSAYRLRNSITAEISLLVIVVTFMLAITVPTLKSLAHNTWFLTVSGDTSEFTAAGFWYVCVSLPIFQFLLLRWYFRIFIWFRFLWNVSRIKLNLVPSHPDKEGGLGFLSEVADAFSTLALAHGALLAGMLANRIFHLGGNLLEFKVELVALVSLMLTLIIAPLLLFTGQLIHTKRIYMREFGQLAVRYSREFDAKWLEGKAPAEEPFIGSADIQSLADLGNSFQNVQGMKFFLIRQDSIIQIVMATLLPVAPLLLTIMPLEELLKKLLSLLM